MSKTAWITGGSRGIGAATALLAAGAIVELSEQAGCATGALLDIAGGR